MNTLQPDHCYIYSVKADELPINLAHIYNGLTQCEVDRVSRFKFEKDQRQSLCAHWLRRHIISQITGETPCNLRFKTAAAGKPYLIDHEHIQFNLTHSHGVVLLAIMLGTPVGVDVEVPRTSLHHLELAQRFFSPHEYDLLLRQPIEQRPLLFYRLWVAKEAILKAHGSGITQYLDQVRLNLSDEGLVITELPEVFGDRQHWHLSELVFNRDVRAAIAAPNPIKKTELFAVKFP